MRTARVLARACAAVCILNASRAIADTTETVRLSWVRDDTAAACPDARAVANRVRTQLGRDPFAEDASTSAEVAVEKKGEEFVARLRVRGNDGALRGERTLRSQESCDTLASAVALALAIYVDPDAALRAPPPQPSASAPIPSLPAPGSRPPPAPPPSSLPPPPAATASPSALMDSARAARAGGAESNTPDHDSDSSRPARSQTSASGEAGVLAARGLLPGPGWGVTISADVEPAARVHVMGVAALWPEERTSEGSFAFGLTSLGAGACFDALATRAWRLAPCVALDGGEIHAVVYPSTLHPLAPASRFWAAAQVLGRARFRIVSALFAEARVGLVAPLIRYGFSVIGEAQPVFREDALAPTVSVGTGLSFP